MHGMRDRGRGGGEGVRTRDHLANVRTTLAWVRVGIVLVGIGYALDKLAAVARLSGSGGGLALARPVGLLAVAGGVAVAAAALARFLGARARIESPRFEPWPVIDLALAAVVGACALLVLLALMVAR
jgi:putative membrane protein